MSQTSLCQLPSEPLDGCCNASSAPAAAPLPINNSPGLSSVGYRIGTFTSFRRAMLDQVASSGSTATSPPTAGPFANWREGADGDYQTVFIELWAYLADILTFYQERIANEAYIGTATQSVSARLLTQLIDYLPAPGSGASGLVAFNVANGNVLVVPQGFRVASRAQPGQAAATFETSSPLTVRAEHNAIALSTVAPTNQFAQLSSFAKVFYEAGPLTIEPVLELYQDVGSTLLRTLTAARLSSSTATSLAVRSASLASVFNSAIATFRPAPIFPGIPIVYRPPIVYHPYISQTTRTVVLAGVSNRLAGGDYVITVENEHSDNEVFSFYQISTVSADKNTNTTTITWRENSGKQYDQSDDNPVTLYALRVQAGPFASAAPNWNTLSPTLTTPSSPPGNPNPPYQENWDDGSKAKSFIAGGNAIALDGIYDSARATPDNPGLAALVTTKSGLPVTDVYRVVNTQPVVLTDYALNTRVTQLLLANGNTVPDGTFGIRDTLILTGSEALTLQDDLPLPDPLQGDTLILDGLYPNLQVGQLAIISGNLFDPTGSGVPGEAATEVCRLGGQLLQDTVNNLTTVQLQNALQNQYVRSTTVLLANVGSVTQGETVADEILGSSDGSALQSYTLKKQPLTYLPSTNAQSGAAVQSTLAVLVNGVQWLEKPTLFDSGAAEQDFTVTQDSTGASTVAFGDGVNGARPPSGVNNVHARYRIGLGGSGNAPAGTVQQLVSNLAGLQRVTNPLPTLGGADPESLSDVRSNAPDSVRAFDRAVSIEDYATLARSFPGIAKASAQRVQFDANRVPLVHPYVQLTAAATDGTPISGSGLISQLRSFLDQRRDPNVPLRILDFTPVYVDIAVTINLDDRVPRQATFARVQAALNPGRNPDGTAGYFAFDSLDFGESLHLSAIYAFIQNIPGVNNATISRFRRMDLDAGDPSVVRTDILIGPTEIGVIGNDASHPERGLLVIVQGDGGFIDT
jgi:predicted phage baseplate assembly protein